MYIYIIGELDGIFWNIAFAGPLASQATTTLQSNQFWAMNNWWFASGPAPKEKPLRFASAGGFPMGKTNNHLNQPHLKSIEPQNLVGGWATPLKNMIINWDD